MTAHLPRRRLLQAGLAGVAPGLRGPNAIAGTALLRPGVRAAVADQALDIMLLQTSASIENVLIAAYESALALPFVGAATPNTGATPSTTAGASSTTSTTTAAAAAAANTLNLRVFLGRVREHHVEHVRTFNETVAQLGGPPQAAPNPALATLVAGEMPGVTDSGRLFELLLRLESAASQTYQHNVPAFVDINARRLTASITGVEAQHVAILRVARALAANRTPDLFSLDPGVPARLPADVGKAGFPDAIVSNLDQARPPAEGAVK